MWFSNYRGKGAEAYTAFNSSYAVTREGLNKLVEQFNIPLGSLFDFTSEISGIQFFPIKLPITKGIFIDPILATSRGSSYVRCRRINTQNTLYYLGAYYVSRKFNNYLDYNQFSSLKVFLPYYGFLDLNVDECLGQYLHFKLQLDISSGQGMYIIGVSDDINQGHDTLFEFRIISTVSCQLSRTIPIGTSNWDETLLNGMLNTMSAAVSLTNSGQLTPAKSTTHTVKTYDIKGRSKTKGSRMKQLKSGTEETVKTTIHEPAVYDKSSDCFDSAVDVLNAHIPGSSSQSNTNGLLYNNITTHIHIIRYYPRVIFQDYEFDHLYGKPFGETVKLKNISGYCVVGSVHIEGDGFMSCTAEERSMIEETLITGVILPDRKDVLTIKSVSDVSLSTRDSEQHWDGLIEYSTDGEIWTEWTGERITAYRRLLLRGTENTIITGESGGQWVLGGEDIRVIGNIETLLDYDKVSRGIHPDMGDWCFYNLFSGSPIIEAPYLGSDVVMRSGYKNMFSNCYRLENAPVMTASVIMESGCDNMFSNCANLLSTGEFNFTSVKSGACREMFKNCYRLNKAGYGLKPLVAYTNAYLSMFEGCSSLKEAPVIKATSCGLSAFRKMFKNCSNLVTVYDIRISSINNAACEEMFYGCTSLKKPPSMSSVNSMGDYACRSMFENCTSLDYINYINISSYGTDSMTSMYKSCSNIGVSSSGASPYYNEFSIVAPSGLIITDMFANTYDPLISDIEVNITYYTFNDIIM